jgi:hypothetical protein
MGVSVGEVYEKPGYSLVQLTREDVAEVHTRESVRVSVSVYEG